MSAREGGTGRSGDWLPWIIVGIIALAFAALALNRKGESGELSERTRGTGLPLTAEQRSVQFRTADLTFEILPSKRAIKGLAKLGFLVEKPISKLQFDLDEGLPIESIAVDSSPLAKNQWANDGGLVTVTLPRAKRAGEALKLDIAYGGTPHVAKRAPWDGGFVWSKTKQGKPWVATAVQGEGCDLFWPCFDNSLVEIGTVDLHIIVPDGLVAPANGKLLGVRELDGGRRAYDWRTVRPNNYAISLNVAPYQQLTASYASRFGNTIPLSFWYLPGEDKQAKALFAEFAPTLDFFESVIGPYPFAAEKVGAVETPHLGMEHQTINAYGNAFKPSPEGYDWLFHHEFSHEWFGNQLTNRNWDDMWLHEGFGSYMQPLYMRWSQGEIPYHAWLWKQRAALMNIRPLVSGRPRLEHDVYDSKTGPGLDIYYKGAWVLHTLRETIGDDAFYRSVRRLVYGRADPRPGNFAPRFGSTDEFVKIVGEESGRDMRWFFDAYVRHARLPKLVERRDGNRLSLQWRTPGGIAFPMPVEVMVDGALQTVAMADGRGTISLPSANSHYAIDPAGKLLRQSDAMERFRKWDEADKAKKAKS
jgi:aminopeptidase N